MNWTVVYQSVKGHFDGEAYFSTGFEKITGKMTGVLVLSKNIAEEIYGHSF